MNSRSIFFQVKNLLLIKLKDFYKGQICVVKVLKVEDIRNFYIMRNLAKMVYQPIGSRPWWNPWSLPRFLLYDRLGWYSVSLLGFKTLPSTIADEINMQIPTIQLNWPHAAKKLQCVDMAKRIFT